MQNDFFRAFFELKNTTENVLDGIRLAWEIVLGFILSLIVYILIFVTV